MSTHTALKGSPTYMAHRARYGATLRLAVAVQIACDHSTTLGDLVEESGMTQREDGGVDTAEMFAALGY